jgi:hypothetical protein
MKSLLIQLFLITAFVSCERPEVPQEALKPAEMNMLVELPRPNGGHFSFKEAEDRKNEIYTALPSLHLTNWVAPKFGFGFCIHLTSDDRIEVTNYNAGFENDKTNLNDVPLPKLKEMINLASMPNEPARIVVTTERDLNRCKVFPEILDSLFKPSIQILYVPTKK